MRSLFDLQFLYPQFLAGQEAPCGTRRRQGRHRNRRRRSLLPAVQAACHGRNSLDDEPRSVHEGVPGTRFEAELDRLGHDTGEGADLEGDRDDPPSLRILRADINHTLGYRHFVHVNPGLAATWLRGTRARAGGPGCHHYNKDRQINEALSAELS